ncbi:hypothetical protein ACVIW2_007276 [Bradyrhizobium huanghuaihaiense]|uniref:Uncharacterized protein n=1 Tax=Bradyrhizobium huanghuaihaiense TaxID=990078 RepID=A0A562RWH2_9BRAD|nr:hypothetical protein [Bradyrhizobium huanghuaihaiense]TWI72676.1 hypothetical protein IQ16_02254 [Bradyrhizobium huanghuaihaiense]
MTNEGKEIIQDTALFERAATLFVRFGDYIPLTIAFLNHWPTEIKFYPEFVVGNAWKVFLSLGLYQLAAFALRRAVKFATAELAP